MSEALSDLEASFARYLRAESRSPRTIKIHCQAPRFFGQWLTAQGIEPTLDALTRDNLIGWFAHLADTKAPGTTHIRHLGMGRFIRWLIAEGELDDNPMAGIRKPEIPEKPVPVLSDDDLIALLKACQGKEFKDRRDEAMVRMLLDCGLRVSELCGITVDTGAGEGLRSGTLDLPNGSALVTGKRGKVRAVYFGAKTERALDRYLRMRRAHKYGDLDALFLGERGALGADGVRYRMEVRAQQAGLTDPANPHRFRHTWADDFLFHGGQERDLKRLAGWTSDVMLERYGRSGADRRARQAAKQMRRGDRV